MARTRKEIEDLKNKLMKDYVEKNVAIFGAFIELDKIYREAFKVVIDEYSRALATTDEINLSPENYSKLFEMVPESILDKVEFEMDGNQCVSFYVKLRLCVEYMKDKIEDLESEVKSNEKSIGDWQLKYADLNAAHEKLKRQHYDLSIKYRQLQKEYQDAMNRLENCYHC